MIIKKSKLVDAHIYIEGEDEKPKEIQLKFSNGYETF